MHGPGLGYLILMFMGFLAFVGSFAVLGVQTMLKGTVKYPWRMIAINFVALMAIQFAILWLT